MLFSYPSVFTPAISTSTVIFLLIFVFFAILAIILFAPFSLSLNIGKKENQVWGSINLAWLGLTLKKLEVSPQSIEEFLTSAERKKDGTDGKERQDADERVAGASESAFRRMIGHWKAKDRESRATRPKDIEGEGKARSPCIRSFIDVAPDLAGLLWNLVRSIRIEKFSCRLCFGLDDPAQTAIISGYIWFLASALGIFRSDMIIDPWFDGERLEGQLEAEIRARLLTPIWAVIKALRIREIRRLFKEMLGWI